MAILSRMSWSDVCDAGGGMCNADREIWGDGDDGVLEVVLAGGFVFGISAGRGAYVRLPNLVFNRFIQPMEMCL
jgi:hypothetical protein